MYKIAICDDESTFAKYIQDTLSEILDTHQIVYQIDVYTSCEALHDLAMDSAVDYDLYFLDFFMDQTDGIEFAVELRKVNQKSSIVFIAASVEYAVRGYDVNALDYLIKPIRRDDLERVVVKDFTRHYLILPIYKRRSTVLVRVTEVVYIESRNRNIILYLNNGKEIRYYGSIQQMLCKLSRGIFLRSHQSYIINLNFIREIKYNCAVMDDGRSVPISRKYLEEIREYLSARFI